MTWLTQQQQLYTQLPLGTPNLSIHPITGVWQSQSPLLQSQYWWGGGASQQALNQLPDDIPQNHHLAVLLFGPVQSFLGAGQRLRDWAVASWLCHYLAAVTIYHWQNKGGHVLLPLHHSSPLLLWIRDPSSTLVSGFWQAELPNVFTGIVPTTTTQETENWLQDLRQQVLGSWLSLVQAVETVVVSREQNNPRRYLDGIGWQVMHRDHRHLWSIYYTYSAIHDQNITTISEKLHQELESKKLGRQWQNTWWGGMTSPTAGALSVWHPGLNPIHRNGTWGLPNQQLESWWQNLIQHHSGLFSPEERLNSLELFKRLASFPQYIESALEYIWGGRPPVCPWERFPDQTAVAASWIPSQVTSTRWNLFVGEATEYFNRNRNKLWGIPHIDGKTPRYIHPEILETRNLKTWYSDPDDLEIMEEEWKEFLSVESTSPIQWTVGWRGDGDNMGKWLSGNQYQTQNLSWQRWHPTPEQVQEYGIDSLPPQVPNQTRTIEIPHTLDLSILFGYWNKLLYPLVEEYHHGKVIFAGGDDFLLLGSLPETIELTSNLYHLWQGTDTRITQPLVPPQPGWVQYQDSIYPIPSSYMTFSLGIIIAQRRIPQSLWHKNLNQAYKQAKKEGKNNVCIKVLFNSNQTIEWTCPWPLWDLLMYLQPTRMGNQSALNRWEKLLTYVESIRLKQPDLTTAQSILETLWQSVGIELSYKQIEALYPPNPDNRQAIYRNWEWWVGWISIRTFLARQEQQRQRWLSSV